LITVRFLDQSDLFSQVLHKLVEPGRLPKPFDGAFQDINELTHISCLMLSLFLNFFPFSLQFGDVNIVPLLFKVEPNSCEGLIGQSLQEFMVELVLIF